MLKNKKGILIISQLIIVIILYAISQFFLNEAALLMPKLCKYYNFIMMIAIAATIFIYKHQHLKKLVAIGNLIFILAVVSTGAIIYYQNSLEQTFSCIQNNKLEKEYFILVSKDDAATTIDDVLDKNIGILENDDAEIIIKEFAEKKKTDTEIIKKTTTSDISYQSYSDSISLFNDLETGCLECVIISKYNYEKHSYITGINEYAKNTKIISTKKYPFTSKKEVKKKEFENQNENVISYYINVVDTSGSVNAIGIPKQNYLLLFNIANHKALVVSLPSDYVFNNTTIYNMSADGIANIKDNLEDWYDVKIDYYLSININGIKDYINQIDAIEYNGTELDGDEAYNILSDTIDKSDEEIIKTRSEIVKNVLKQLPNKNIIFKKKALQNIYANSIITNAPSSEIFRLYQKIIDDDLEITTLISADGILETVFFDDYPELPLKALKPNGNSDEEIKKQLKSFSTKQQ